MHSTRYTSHILNHRGAVAMKEKIEVILKTPDKEVIQELMEETLVEIIIDRIKTFPEEQRKYICDELLDKLKESC
jgi:vacuolar-type H+-ATPase subunit E/Vma4